MEFESVSLALGSLFLVSFLAATLLPLGSEALLVALLLNGIDPTLAVLVATTGNTLGAITTWAVGLYGGAWLITRVLRISEQDQRRAKAVYQRWGIWSLLLAWAPIVGDPLCLIGGLFKVRLLPFTLLVAAGKLARYCAIAYLTLAAS